MTPQSSIYLEDGSAECASGAVCTGDAVVIDRREPAFWQRGWQRIGIVPRCPYFVIDVDTGNS